MGIICGFAPWSREMLAAHYILAVARVQRQGCLSCGGMVPWVFRSSAQPVTPNLQLSTWWSFHHGPTVLERPQREANRNQLKDVRSAFSTKSRGFTGRIFGPEGRRRFVFVLLLSSLLCLLCSLLLCLSSFCFYLVYFVHCSSAVHPESSCLRHTDTHAHHLRSCP